MTIKFLQIFLLSTLLSYTLLFSVASDTGIIQYRNAKVNNSSEKSLNNQLKQEILDLQAYKEDLIEGEYVYDLAFELGYVNSDDKVYFIDNNNESVIQNNIVQRNNSVKKVETTIFSNWKKYQFIIFSSVIGLAISICYLLLSKKMESNKDNDQ